MFRIELLVDARNDLGEGPLWDVDEQRLYWIDSHGKAVHRCDARGQDVRSWSVPEHIGSMCLREKGGAVVSLRNGFHFLDLATGEVEPIADPEAHLRRTRLNDGKVDRQGRFLAGGMDYEEREPLGRPLPARPRPRGDAARGRHRRQQRPLLEPRRRDLLLRRHLGAPHLGLRLRHGDRRPR